MRLISDDRIAMLLGIVASFGRPCTAEEFGRKAFPESPAWHSVPKRKRSGWKPGGRGRSASSGVLGQLASMGFVARTPDHRGHYLTQSGRAFLERHAAKATPQPPEQQKPNHAMQSPQPPVEAWWPYPPGPVLLRDGRWAYWSGVRYFILQASGWVPIVVS